MFETEVYSNACRVACGGYVMYNTFRINVLINSREGCSLKFISVGQ